MKENEMKKRVISFGIPTIKELDHKNLEILFEDEEIIGSTEKGYHCRANDVKFCLFDIKNKKPIFSMDFFVCDSRYNFMLVEEPHIKLELLYVHDGSLRKKGIASYYIKKLQQYALENNFRYIKIHPNPNAKNFKGNKGPTKQVLNEFYNRLSTDEMPIKII